MAQSISSYSSVLMKIAPLQLSLQNMFEHLLFCKMTEMFSCKCQLTITRIMPLCLSLNRPVHCLGLTFAFSMIEEATAKSKEGIET